MTRRMFTLVALRLMGDRKGSEQNRLVDANLSIAGRLIFTIRNIASICNRSRTGMGRMKKFYATHTRRFTSAELLAR